MKLFVWLIFGLLLAFWSVLVALSVQLVQWLLSSMDNGQLHELTHFAAQWPVPAWLAVWVDTAWIKGLQDFGVNFFLWFAQVMPSSDGLMNWITPLLYLVWGLGTVFLGICALSGHWLLSKRLSVSRQGVPFRSD